MVQPTDPTDSPKRVRVDPTPTNTAVNQAPLKSAQLHIQESVSSLPPTTASILLRLAKHHLQLRAKLHHKLEQLKKMQDDDTFIPRSARVTFTLAGSKPAEQTPEFQTLRDNTSSLVENFQKDLKKQIIAATKIEKKVLLSQLRTDLATSLRVATRALLLTLDADADEDRIVSNILDNFSTTFLAFLDITKDDFAALYKTTHTIDVFPNPYVAQVHRHNPPNTQDTNLSQQTTQTVDTVDHSDSLFVGEIREAAASRANRRGTNVTVGPTPFYGQIKSIKRSLESLFVTTWSIYQDQAKRNATTIALRQLAADHFDTKATEDAAMEIDTEPPANRTLLSELIQQEVSKRTNKLNSEIGRLKSQLKEKNVSRGRSTGAKPKKSSASPPPSKQTLKRGKSKGRKADGPAKDTTAANKNRKNNNSKPTSNRKHSPSNKKSTKSKRTAARS